ncbi:hypothetical protein TNCT_401481 [Trichonephila clavata]|uniref:Uncharacterized protein n=1 Tax=Trichonephila clavata TaxID=2740835 RepID=A0A8X6K435_TRICU|nr:hypothetical protein TNCT_401481 [Trichonephila clavata]
MGRSECRKTQMKNALYKVDSKRLINSKLTLTLRPKSHSGPLFSTKLRVLSLISTAMDGALRKGVRLAAPAFRHSTFLFFPSNGGT